MSSSLSKEGPSSLHAEVDSNSENLANQKAVESVQGMEVGKEALAETDEIVVVEDHFSSNTNRSGVPDLPPKYEDAVKEIPTDVQGKRKQELKRTMEITPSTVYNSESQFPMTNYYELEGRVHADSWSIPIKKTESLGKCLTACIRMVKSGIVIEQDESCKKFLEKTMPVAFEKLLTSDAVLRWDVSIQEGILDMARLFVELIAERMKLLPIPLLFLEHLTMVFNADINYHVKNRTRRIDSQIWQRRFDNKVFAVCPNFASFKDSKGWLVELMNSFAYYGGVDAIRDRILDTENITIQDLTALFQPFGVCDEYISSSYFKDHFGECVTKAMKYVETLSEADLKHKEAGSVSMLLRTLKTVCLRVWSQESAQRIDQARLDITLRMLKTPHFNAKMNALKEVVKLIEEPSTPRSRGVRNPISKDKILEWLVNNKVLSIALSGNLHQSQYTNKLKSILETVGTRLSLEDLDAIWEQQIDKNPTQVENIHNVLAAAASRFTPHHLDHLFLMIQKSWESGADRYRVGLLKLIGRIGRDDRTGKTATKILELLWSLSHTPQLSPEMAEQALDAHLSILIDSSNSKDTEKKMYIVKCVENIKKEVWVVPAFRQLHRIMKGISRGSSRSYQSKDHLQISDLRKQYDLLKLTTNSLLRWQNKAVEAAQVEGSVLGPGTLVDGRYTHSEFVNVQLKFLALLAQDGGIYLPLKRAVEVWDTLVTNPNSCEDDHNRAFVWFDSGISDFDSDSQGYIYNHRIIKMNPSKLDMAGYRCLRNYYEVVNVSGRKLRKVHNQSSSQLIVEVPEPTGVEYFWKACLEVLDDKVSLDLMADILHMSYGGLDPKLKRDPGTLHTRFLENCTGRIKALLNDDASKDSSPDTRLRTLKRLLILLEKYITLVEDSFHLRRTMPPHGTCFQGHPVSLCVRPENEKLDFRLQCHSNESWYSVRQRVARKLKVPSEQLQIGITERWLSSLLDNKLLHQLGLQDEQDIIVKKVHSLSLSNVANRNNEGQSNQAANALKQEKTLPGVLLASFPSFFDILEKLAGTKDPGLTTAVRTLQMIIPTNPQILQDITTFAESHHQDGSGLRVIEKLFDHHRNSPMQLLYNFEVLSSRILPVREEGLDTVASDFKKHFLKSDGLRFVLDILQKSALPNDVELGIRQDCYAITLSLARFLLCNQTSLPSWRPAVLKRGTSVNVPTRPEATATPPEEEYDEVSEEEDMVTDIDTVVAKKVPENGDLGEDRGDEMARLTIETMSVDDFSTMLNHLIIVSWAAAAGRLHLVGTHEDVSSKLVLGLCVIQKEVSGKDAAVARAALELLVTCLELRVSLLGVFFSMKQVGDFIIDVLVGSAHPEVRTASCVLFNKLCQKVPAVSDTMATDHTPQKKLKISSNDDPRKFFIHTLLNAKVPLWTFSPLRNEGDMRWRTNCIQFFELLCNLLEELSTTAQQLYSVDVGDLLSNELHLVEEVYHTNQTSSDMQNMIAGHLNLLRALFSCDGVDKAKNGPRLVHQLLGNFLFPASSRMLDGGDWISDRVLDFSPVCEEVSRIAAFKLLIELADGCPENLVILTESLTKMHHKEKPHMSKDWEFQPPVIGRAHCGFVGLRNGGATCYMNSVMQHLYMQPDIRQVILTSDIDEDPEGSTRCFSELQSIFGHLLGSKLQFYTPEGFWKTFKLWGQPVNIREQQDAFEFFSNLSEQADEILKKNKLPQIFLKTFGGVFLDEKLCRGCEHRYEREEPFQSISLTVTTMVMEEALKEYFKGELLEGDNAYNCEKCNEKRDTLKRTSIKTLPSVLVIHLKRFGYDWEAGRAIKCDDHFEFPWTVDMLPYTAEGIEGNEDDTTQGETPKSKLYQLTGIVVHSGQASAGHYYSFIKQRKSTDREADKWYRFNDNLVDEVVMDDEMLKVECFGGTYKSGSSARQEMRTRFWNAYMLFYEAVGEEEAMEGESQDQEVPSSPLPVAGQPREVSSDLKELDALVKKGEGGKMFDKGIPSSIQRSINEENLLFMQNKEVYTPEYWKLMKNLTDVNIRYLVSEEVGFSAEQRESVGLASFQLGINFLLHTYIRTKKKLRSVVDREAWLTSLTHIMTCCASTSRWLLDMVSVQPGSSNLKVFLLECPSSEMRFLFAKLLLTALQKYFDHGGDEKDVVDRIIEHLLNLLQHEVIDCYRFSTQYFDFLREYSAHEIGGPHLLEKDGLMRFVTFLMEPPSQTQQRSWAPQQVREFRPIFAVIANLIRQTDVSSFCKGDAPQLNPYSLGTSLRDPKPSFRDWYKKQDENRKFVKELVLSLREADALVCDSIGCMLCYCCYDNEALSAITLDDLMLQVATHASNELKHCYKVLTDIMLIADPFQMKRIKYTIEGSKSKPDHGIFNVMDDNKNHDSRRTYQAVKFIIQLANKSPEACQLISKHSDKWQWSVAWLKKKIKENYSSPSQTATIVSNDTSTTRTFQRTVSAQNTLEEATVLLSEIESHEYPKETESQSHKSENGTETQNGTGDVIG